MIKTNIISFVHQICFKLQHELRKFETLTGYESGRRKLSTLKVTERRLVYKRNDGDWGKVSG